MPLLEAAAIGAGALIGNAVNAWQTGRMNRKSMNFSREMYARQQADLLENWHLQNEYNSPQAQMKRFQDAGLNPHLIYGRGDSGGAAPISTPDVQSPQFRTPEWGNAISSGGLNFMNAIYDLDIKQAQADNLRANNTVIEREAMLKGVQIAVAQKGLERSTFDLDFMKEFRGVSGDLMRESLRQRKVATDVMLRRDYREAVLSSSSVAEAFSRMQTAREQRLNMQLSRTKDRVEIARIRQDILNGRQRYELMKKEGFTRDWENNLRKHNVNPNDPLAARLLVGVFEKLFDHFGMELPDFGDDDAK